MKCMVCSVDNGNVDLATMSAQILKNIPMFLNVGQIAPLAIDFADAPHSKRERSCVLSLKLVVHDVEKGNGRGSIRRACPKKKNSNQQYLTYFFRSLWLTVLSPSFCNF